MAKSEQKETTSFNDKMKLAIKKSAHAGSSLLGFTAGFGINKFLVPAGWKTGLKGVFASFIMFAMGVAIATFSNNEYIQSAGLGLSAYGGIKTVNNLVGTKIEGGVVGGIDGIPMGMREAIASYVPSLSGMDDFVIEGLGNTEEQPEYVFVDGLGNVIDPSDTELYLPVSGYDQDGNPIYEDQEQPVNGLDPSDMFA